MPAKKVLSPVVSQKKPSLASLMPDKSKNVAAKKKAVKKIEAAHVSKKSATKAPREIVKRKSSDKTGLKVVKRTSKTKTSKTAPDFAVVLPSNMSIRAREKALVILDQIAKDFKVPAQQVAYISGLCFILLGSSLSLAFSGVMPGGVPNQANTINSTMTTGTNATQTTGTQTIAAVIPEISLIDPLPVEVRTLTEHKLAVTNADQVVVKSKSLKTGDVVTLPTNKMSTELYKFVIDPAKLVAGEQDARAFVKATDGNYHEFQLGRFYVPLPSNTTASSSPSGSSSGDSTTLTNSGTSDISTAATGDIADQVTTEQQSASTTTEVEPTVTNPVTKLIAPTGDYKGFVLVKFSVLPTTFTGNIVVYIRDPKSTTRKFVGSAERYQDYWRFYFDTKQVPNGDYELFSVAIPEGQRKEYRSENSQKIRIANFVTTQPVTETNNLTAPTSNDPTNTVTTDTETMTTTDKVVVEQSGRSLPDFTIINVEDDKLSEENKSDEEMKPVTVEVADVLAPHEAKIRELLNRYAVAIQSGDELLLEIAKKEIESGKRHIIEQVLADKSINFLADEVSSVLEDRFDVLKKRVETFEELRRTASNEESSVDTDNDGISDVDEKTLYNTDPSMPDSDNDGVLDGVEIMRGFNPTDPAGEAVVEYEMPQDSQGLIETEVLKVASVTPIIKSLADDGGKEVHAEISGTALPNSYVTLYIFSTPTIVTVRADEQGIFSYSFEKELEDGEHEVYVAITDNTGAIMARSNPFKFVKQAEAFTPVDTNTVDIVAPQSIDTFTMMNSYNTVAGLGILALGLILLMLGINMREKKDDVEVIEPAHDLKTA